MSSLLRKILTSFALVVALTGCRGLGETKGREGDRAETGSSADAGVGERDAAVPVPSGPRPCAATSECAAGERCSVEDGACNRPPSCGPSDVCAEVCYGVCQPSRPSGASSAAQQRALPGEPTPAPHASGAKCTKDADCRTFSDYCTGCDCRALGADEPAPKCAGPGVRCLVDPCMRKHAACVEGRCAVGIGASSPVQ